MAEPWLNFMDAYRGPHGGFGMASWREAAKNYSPSQIKTALQQQGQRGSSIGSGLRTNYMQKHKGAAHGINRFMGPHGNIGLNSYNAIKAAGFNIDDIPNLAAQGGMFLPEGAEKQWNIDMAEKYKEEKFEDPYYSADASGVGTSAMGVKSKKDPNAGKTSSTSDLKRKNMLINKSLNV